MEFLGPADDFPPVASADKNGLLAVGGDLSGKRLLEAYSQGIFPWYEAAQPILWWSPDPRMVLFPEELRVSSSMKQVLRRNVFSVSFDQAFDEVISRCAAIPRKGQKGTWITPEMMKAYSQLHKEQIAHSVEVWQGKMLVGGLYGILLERQRVFCGESMFSQVSNSSKFAFIKLVEVLKSRQIRLIDCQVYTAHLESLGAREIPRSEFLSYLN